MLALDKKQLLIDKITTEARTWINTPHKHNQALKGERGGVDCVRFPYQVAIACNLSLIDPGNYERNPNGEQLIDCLQEQLYLVGCAKDAYNWSDKYLKYCTTSKQLQLLIEPCDILVYKREWLGHPGHLALAIDEKTVIQSFIKTGVRETGMGTAKLLCAVFRFKELCN